MQGIRDLRKTFKVDQQGIFEGFCPTKILKTLAISILGFLNLLEIPEARCIAIKEKD